MLDQSYIPEMITYFEEHLEQIEPDSPYQLGRFQNDVGWVRIYRSGIVIFSDQPSIRSIISDFLSGRDLAIPEFEQYQVAEEEPRTSSGWEETPKGVWLTQGQRQLLYDLLVSEYDEIDAEKHESARFKQDDQLLVLNDNGVVYTIGGFDNLHQYLQEVIQQENPYQDYSRLVILDQEGKWDRLGPVCLTLVDIMTTDAMELQLAGVKDSLISRGTDHTEFIPEIEEHCSYSTLFLTPEEINTAATDRDQYQNFLSGQYQNYLNGQLLNLNEDTLVICDSSLAELIDHDHLQSLDRDHRISPALGISSTISNAMIEKWNDDWYKQLGIRINRNNITTIRSHPKKAELAKLFLL